MIRLIADIAIRVPLEYLSEMRRDMRYALRALIKSPGFALVGIISMGLGIGLTTNVYSSKWAMLFRDLPAAANAKQLVMPRERRCPTTTSSNIGEQKNLFAGVAAFQTGVPFNVTFQGDVNAKPERVFGQLVSPDYFSVLGVKPSADECSAPDSTSPAMRPGGDQRSFLAQSPELLARRGGTNASPERANRDHRGNHAEEFQWRAGYESGRAVRPDHRAGRARAGARERCSASTQCQGIPGDDVPGAGRHD